MLCIFLVLAYPYDRLIEPLRTSKRYYNHFHTHFDRQQISKQTKVRLWTHFFLSLVKHTFIHFICLVHTQKRGGKNSTLLQLVPEFHAICLLDTNQKVKIDIMDDTDAVNLLAHIFPSSHRAYKHPLPTETQREAGRSLRHSCILVISAWL